MIGSMSVVHVTCEMRLWAAGREPNAAAASNSASPAADADANFLMTITEAFCRVSARPERRRFKHYSLTANKLEVGRQAPPAAGIAFAQWLGVISPRDLPEPVVSPRATGAQR